MNLTSINTIKDLFKRHGFSFTKSLGQNFLINPSVCPRIIPQELRSGAENTHGSAIALEIGAGIGVLTKELAKTCKKVVCIEIDKTLKPILDETLAEFNNVEIIWEDVMKLDLKRLFAEKFNADDEIICCANLPYYITSPVIMRLLEERLPLKSITVMVQKEAAVRLCAEPGRSRAPTDCGAVSVAVRYYSRPKKLFDVSRGSFMPAPNVDSSVIRLTVGGDAGHTTTRIELSEEPRFFNLVRAAFSQRRKQLANPVSASLNLQKEKVTSALISCGLKPTARAEELTLNDFINLHKELSAQ